MRKRKKRPTDAGYKFVSDISQIDVEFAAVRTEGLPARISIQSCVFQSAALTPTEQRPARHAQGTHGKQHNCVIAIAALEAYFWLEPDLATPLKTFRDGYGRIRTIAERKLLAHPATRLELTAADFARH